MATPSAVQKTDSAVAKLEGGKTQASLAKCRSVRMALQKVLAGDDDKLQAFIKGVVRFKRIKRTGK